jgi:hypothetical protein
MNEVIMPEESVKLFISYCHRDETLRQQLDKHLAPLKGQKVIEAWHDRQIRAGDEWANQIDDNLNNADIILLLISPDFVASDYCSNIELAQAVKRHENGEAIIVPVILEPCDWSWLPFAKFQAFPKDGKAITTWGNQNEAFLDVAMGLRKVAQELFAKRQQKLEQKKTDREKYKAKVEEALSLSTDSTISPADRDTLDELREELELTKQEADAIEHQAFRPFKDREEKLEKYKKTLRKYIENGDYPFSDEVKRQLENRQRDLGIKIEDIEKVTQPILAQAEVAYQKRLQAKAQEQERQREYQAKLQQYEQEFRKAIEAGYPLDSYVRDGLNQFQQSLEVSDEDVARIEAPLVAPKKAAYEQRLADEQRRKEEAEQRRREEAEQRREKEAEQRREEEAERRLELERQQKLEQQRQEQLKQEAAEKQRQPEAQERQRQEAEELKRQQAEAGRLTQEALEQQRVLLQWVLGQQQQELASEKGIDYAKLRDLLQASKWREADRETYLRMLEAVGSKDGDWFRAEELQAFPCADLQTIDRLWVKYSNGHFGFSVQRKIWQECGSPKSTGNDWDRFCVKVGWKKASKTAIDHSKLKFDPQKSPKGELPYGDYQLGESLLTMLGWGGYRDWDKYSLAHRRFAGTKVGIFLSCGLHLIDVNR